MSSACVCVVSLLLVFGPVWLADVAFGFGFAFDGIYPFGTSVLGEGKQLCL